MSRGSETLCVGPDESVQFIADNVDHDVCTIDGNGTFHGMEMMATFNPGSCAPSQLIPHTSVTADEIRRISNVNMKYFASHHTDKPPMIDGNGSY